MSIKVKNLPGSQKEVLFEIDWKEFQPFFKKAVEKIATEVEFKGFRKGKAPQRLVEEGVGIGVILDRAAELCIEKYYFQYLNNNNIQALGAPRIEILKLAKNNPFSFKIRVSVLPEIVLPDYKKIARSVKRQEVQVSEREVGEAIDWLRRSRADFKDLKTEAQKGNFVRISYQSPELEKGRRYQDAFVLGKGGFVGNFEENLEGMKPGQSKQFWVRFPEDYSPKSMAGKKVRFNVKMERVQEIKLPPLNDEFAKELGRFESLAELKESVRQGLLEEKRLVEREKRRALILEKISREVKCELPERLVELEKSKIKKEIKSNEKDLKPQDFKEIEKEAKKRVKNFLLIKAIGEREKIQVLEQEIEQAAQEFLKRFPNPQAAQKEVDPEQIRDYYRYIIYQEKVLQKLESF